MLSALDRCYVAGSINQYPRLSCSAKYGREILEPLIGILRNTNSLSDAYTYSFLLVGNPLLEASYCNGYRRPDRPSVRRVGIPIRLMLAPSGSIL